MTTVGVPEVGRSVGRRLPLLLGRLVRGNTAEAAWVAPAMLGVVGLAVVLYLVNLTVSGYANTYYSAAALAGSQSWSAWFFGSIDSANFITVDKPPLGTMLIGLSVRLFGLSSGSILLPEALAGIATVVVLMATVRRTFGSAAAVIAGLVSALTPAAVLIFRYDNPDALLTLLLVGSAYAFIRSLERGSLRWVAAAAVLVGFGFLTKYLQAWFVLPAFALTWLMAAPGSIGRRMFGLGVAFVAVVVASGWWVAVMELIPAANRPFIGGSDANSVVELLLGYDGLGRIFGQGGGPGGGGPGGGFSGSPGPLRLFNAEFGGQIGWLLPLAVASIAIGLSACRRLPRTDKKRAAYVMWGLWLAVHAVVFSFMSGIVHTYYAVAMAPAIGALVGGGLVELWRLRERVRWGGLAMAAAVTASAALAWQLLERTPAFAPGLGLAILALSIPVGVVLIGPARLTGRRSGLIAATLGVGLMLAGPAAYAADTTQTAYSSGDPSAGPAVVDTSGGGRFGGGGPVPGGLDGGALPGIAGADGGVPPAADGGGPGGFGGRAGQVDTALVEYLVTNRAGATWIVAVNGSNEAASIELASGLPVMAMGGFSGGDPAPTLAQLQAFVAGGQLRYILIGGAGRGGPNGASSDITSWVATNGKVVDAVGNGTLYDLSGAITTGT